MINSNHKSKSILTMWSVVIIAMLMAHQRHQEHNSNSFVVLAYTNSPLIDRRAISGLWKLSKFKPLKEFTVFPQKEESYNPELLLMLNEDGSFKRYFNQRESTITNDNDDDDEEGDDIDENYDISTEWGDYINYQKNLDPSWKNVNQGTWDFRDGELMLAVDRQNKNNNNNLNTATTTNKNNNVESSKSSSLTTKKSPLSQQQDTLLVGEVSASVIPVNNNNDGNDQNKRGGGGGGKIQEQRLTVPIGSLNVGKFTYPKKHPSFFDQPMFQPKPKSVFQLRQVLGTFQYKGKEEPVIEKFHNKDFYNKRFTLTSQPLSNKKRTNNKRDISYKQRMEEEEEEKKRLVMNIRVMEVMFFANNTFTTVAGLGGNTILRGRYDVIGKEKDQLWMQVRRFGFGRSVSGSIYSEGMGLSHEEEKSYWGKIAFEGDENDPKNRRQGEEKINMKKEDSTIDETENTMNRIQAEGSVILGWGLEPQPVAKFIMKEINNEEYDDEDYDDDEEEDDEDDDDDVPIIDDWSNAFQ